MDEVRVVTVFLRHGSDVLLLRRSDEVGSYAGRWGTVAGHAEGDSDAMALAEIEEEAGIPASAVTLVRKGDPFDVVDESRGTRWIVTPYLFDVETRAVETNWETESFEWTSPTAILERETVPDLWKSYDRVRPSVESVETDTTHGSGYISLRALEVLRDEAALLEPASAEWNAIASVAAELRAARPEMAVVRNRINRVMAETAETGTPEAVFARTLEEIERASEADSRAAARAAQELSGATVFTLSRSGTVFEALERGDPDRIVVAESRPGSEGVGVADALAERGFDVVLTGDANIPGAVADADVVLLGADTVLADGDVVNKVGSTAAALAGEYHDVDRFAVCSRDKISPDSTVELDAESPDALREGLGEFEMDTPAFELSNPVFERVPGDLLDGIITEAGTLDEVAVGEVAGRHARLGDWSVE